MGAVASLRSLTRPKIPRPCATCCYGAETDTHCYAGLEMACRSLRPFFSEQTTTGWAEPLAELT